MVFHKRLSPIRGGCAEVSLQMEGEMTCAQA